MDENMLIEDISDYAIVAGVPAKVIRMMGPHTTSNGWCSLHHNNHQFATGAYQRSSAAINAPLVL